MLHTQSIAFDLLALACGKNGPGVKNHTSIFKMKEQEYDEENGIGG
ncbi:hypothetical protein [Longitalea arenae]|nr:hypothetical protein [Longitalea arenae]